MKKIAFNFAVTVLVGLPMMSPADEPRQPNGSYVLPLFNEEGSKKEKNQSQPRNPTFPEEYMDDSCDHNALSA